MAGFQVPAVRIIEKPSRASVGKIQLDYRRFVQNGRHVTELPEFKQAAGRVVQLHDLLMKGKNDLLKDGKVVMTGWKIESPFISDSELDGIQAAGKKFADATDVFWSCGIGGSYLGVRATIEALKGSMELFNLLSREQRGGAPQILFFGQNMDPVYVATALTIMKGKRAKGGVISKSGGTVEPAILFAILENAMLHSMDPSEVAKSIVAITDKDANKSKLKKLATEKGYATYTVPDNVGGRYSVTSPAGLLALAVAGIDLKNFIAGAKYAEEQTKNNLFEKNISMLRAAMRYAAYMHDDKEWQSKKIEVASTGVFNLRGVTYWMQQLGPESEGKNGQGLYIGPEYYTEMAHANGQLIRGGERNLFETFLIVENPDVDVVIPGKGTPVDYLDGKTLNFANTAFIEGLRDDHYEGGVPTMSYVLQNLDAYTLGMLYQYEMNAIALSALLLGQNPFIQPNVEGYKKIANAKSGKPGTEALLNQMKEAEAKLNPKFIV